MQSLEHRPLSQDSSDPVQGVVVANGLVTGCREVILNWRKQAESLIDALPSCCRLIGTCGHARKVSRSQRICWTVMYRKPTSHVGHVVRIVEEPGINSTFDFQRAAHSSHI